MEVAKERYAFKSRHLREYCSSSGINKLCSIFNSIFDFFRPIKRLWIPRTKGQSKTPRINVLCLAIINRFSTAATFGTMHTVVLYTTLKFDWIRVKFGYVMCINWLRRSLVLLKLLEKKFHLTILTSSINKLDKRCLTLSLLFVFVAFLSFLVFHDSLGVYMIAGL